MIKTDFMKLYEKLENINESISDIDFKTLTTAEEEADRLGKEIWDLEKKYSKKVYTAVNADEQYKKFKVELGSLRDQLDKLKATYERREIINLGDGDFDYDYWTDEDAYELVKDRVAELRIAIRDLEAKLREVEAAIKKQFEADQLAINSKKAERDQHKSTADAIKNQLNQSYADAETEVTEAAKALGLLVDEPILGSGNGHVKSSIEPRLAFHKASGRMLATVVFTITGDYGYLDYEDFNEHSDELLDSAAASIEKYAVEEGGCYPEDIANAYELSPAGEEGWYKIPGSDWELWKEYDAALVDAPTISYDRYDEYEIDEAYKVEVNIYLGKKVN